MGLTFRLRHYWSKADYTRLFNLRKDGKAEDLAVGVKNPDVNLNLFNIDMNYTWQIAPGSFINVNWKTSSDLATSWYWNSTTTISSALLINLSSTVSP